MAITSDENGLWTTVGRRGQKGQGSNGYRGYKNRNGGGQNQNGGGWKQPRYGKGGAHKSVNAGSGNNRSWKKEGTRPKGNGRTYSSVVADRDAGPASMVTFGLILKDILARLICLEGQ